MNSSRQLILFMGERTSQQLQICTKTLLSLSTSYYTLTPSTPTCSTAWLILVLSRMELWRRHVTLLPEALAHHDVNGRDVTLKPTSRNYVFFLTYFLLENHRWLNHTLLWCLARCQVWVQSLLCTSRVRLEYRSCHSPASFYSDCELSTKCLCNGLSFKESIEGRNMWVASCEGSSPASLCTTFVAGFRSR